MRQGSETKKTGGAGFIVHMMWGSAFGLALTVLLLLVCSIFVAGGTLPVGLMPHIATGALFLGAMLSSLAAVGRYHSRALPMGLAVGAGMFFVTLVVGAFMETETLIGASTPAFLIAVLLGGALGALIRAK